MADDFTLNILLEEDRQDDEFDPISIVQNTSADSTAETEDLATEDTDGISFFEAFAERAADNIITRPFTRPLRIAAEKAGDLAGLDIDSGVGDQSFFESTMPLEDLPENSISGAILGDIFGETVTGAVLGQQALSRLGTHGRVAGAAGGALLGAARATPRALRASLAIQRARGASSTVIEEALRQSQRPAFRTLGDDLFFDLQETAANSPARFIAQELLPFTTAATGGVALAEATQGDRDAEVTATGIGAVIGSILSPSTIGSVVGSSSRRAGQSLSNVRDFLFRRSGSARDIQLRRKAAEKLTLVAEKAGVSIEEVLRTIDDSMQRVAGASPAVQRVGEIADEVGISAPELMALSDSPDDIGRLNNIAIKVGMVDEEGTPQIGQLQSLLTEARQFQDATESLPVGNLTGNEFLVALQRRASSISPESSGQDQLNLNSFMDGMLSLDAVLRSSGDPQALVVAAQVRQQAFETLLDTRIEVARIRALDRLENVTVPLSADPSDVRRGASKRVYETLDEALTEARKTETSLYQQLGRDVPVGNDRLTAFRQSLENAKEVLGDFYSDLPMIGRVESLAREGGTIANAAKLKSRLADKERRLRSAGSFDEARDLRELVIKPMRELLDSPETKIANEFSVQLNNAFTRSVTQRFLGTNREGGLRVDPEAMLGEILRGGGDAATIRLDRILESAQFGDRAAQFGARIRENFGNRRALLEAVQENEELLIDIPRQDLVDTLAGFDTEFGASIMRETDLFIRALASEFRDERGQVDVTRFVSFIRNNNTVIDKFPDLKADLESARTAALHIRRVEDQSKLLNNATMTRRLFGGLIGQDNPTPVVQRALRSPNRTRLLRNLATTARRAEEGIKDNDPIPGAMDGLRTTILDALYMNSKQGDGFRWDTYREALLAPAVGSNTSLLDDMMSMGILDEQQAERLRRLVDTGAQVQTAMRNPADLDATIFNVGKTNPITEAFVAVTGSSIAGAIAKKMKSALGMEAVAGDIVANQQGAAAFRNFFVRRGEAEVMDMIMEATSNAKLFNALFEEFDPTSLTSASSSWQTLKIALISSEFKAIQDTSLEEEYDDAADLPPMPEPLEEEDEKPDFFDTLNGEP